jgi:hypothetical protein
MKNLTITRKLLVSLAFSADQWELYDDEPGEFKYQMREGIAKSLNANIESYVENGYTRQEIENKMQYWFSEYSEYGADDTAVREVFHQVLDTIFKG